MRNFWMLNVAVHWVTTEVKGITNFRQETYSANRVKDTSMSQLDTGFFLRG
jgi:hypothetical protein